MNGKQVNRWIATKDGDDDRPVVFIIEVDTRLVPHWELFHSVVIDELSSQFQSATFIVMPAEHRRNVPDISVALSNPLLSVVVPTITDTMRRYMVKRTPTKLVTYNDARMRRREPRFIYDNSMMDDPPVGFPRGEYKPTTEPVMGLRI